ncbi:DUF2267 domain-containing protein [Antarcticimicrobium luteum]|uniref:DUF2267 domain-containing protein n=1 Tax=Antarcticimicrobium luteum TaxID=2547397 RepID=A0A4R5USX7_9RHOB|nr:DUF2267 domain-containing protein [Antarcticimicrobium luteum]TDK42222.1 DUF2267 domain-containing protein [Antarcticimicrobium luteum]
MPMPHSYRHATREWRAFLTDARERMELMSDNNTYTAIQGVFLVFRRRVSVQQGLIFASMLPCVPRAIFVADWDISEPIRAFGTREEMTREAQALRPHHNLTPQNAIEATAWAVRRAVLPADFERALGQCPPQAADFWSVDAAPAELGPRIV